MTVFVGLPGKAMNAPTAPAVNLTIDGQPVSVATGSRRMRPGSSPSRASSASSQCERRSRSAGPVTFGTTSPSGAARATAAVSASPSPSSGLMRTQSCGRLPASACARR